jgi:hypothetical protein
MDQVAPLVLLPVLLALEVAVSTGRWVHEMAAVLRCSRPGGAAGPAEAVAQLRPSLASDAGLLLAGLGTTLLL